MSPKGPLRFLFLLCCLLVFAVSLAAPQDNAATHLDRGAWAALGLLIELLTLVGIMGTSFILIHAFKNGGALQGILCLCVPFYIIYYMFAKFEHKKKNLIILGCLGFYLVGGAFWVVFLAAVFS